MKIINIGSMNIDRVYRVKSFVKPKETIKAESYAELCGGKGLNQSVAAARAGGQVSHAGMLGRDGQMLLELLRESGADTGCIRILDSPSGHAMIQVDEEGQNSIIIHGGSNQLLSKEYIREVLDKADSTDILLLQNEVSNLACAIEEAAKRGIRIALNPSPVSEELETCDLSAVSCFLLNEIEGQALARIESEEPEEILRGLRKRFGAAVFVLTMGEKGAYYMEGERILKQEIFPVKAVDTTGAGDTFCGYFLACLSMGKSAEDCLRYAGAAAAIAVSRSGAALSIPMMREVEAFLKSRL